MRLAISMRPEWTRMQSPFGLKVNVRPGLRFLIQAAQPVPLDARTWGDRIVYADVPADRVKVHRVDDSSTDEGWPVTYVVSDVLKPDGAAVHERRIHAIVRIAQHAVVVIAQAQDPALIDEFDPVFAARIRTSRAVFDDVGALAHVWEGLEVNDLSPPTDVTTNVSPTSE